MLQTMGPNMDFEVTKLILSEIARLKRMPELQHKIEAYAPQPDPLVQKAKELEVMKLEKEIALIDSQIMKNQAESQKKMADAEQVVLDTVEQETGTEHTRALEKQVAQSTGNQNLEVTKSLLKPRKPNERGGNIEAAVGYNSLTKRDGDPRTPSIL